MRSKQRLTSGLALAALLVLACSCASREPRLTAYPPSADLRAEAKPELTVESLASDNALALHDDAIEAWGERGWATVGRLCRWSVANGHKLPFKCLPPPDS